MLHIGDVFNPSRCFFTTADFENTLLTIAGHIKDYESKTQTGSFDLKEKKALLEKAYRSVLTCLSLIGDRKPDKPLILLLGNIISHYGRLSYDENYFTAKQLLLVALNMHLYVIDILPNCMELQEFPTLEELSRQCQAKPHLLAAFEENLASMHIEGCITAAFTSTLAQSTPSKRLLDFAECVRWLTLSYQSIDVYQPKTSANDQRYRQLYSLSEGLFLMIDDEVSRHELADFYFQAAPYLHLRQRGNDANALSSTYNKALSCDNSVEMQARVANKRFQLLFNAGQKSDAFTYLKQAFAGLKELKDIEATRALMASVHCSFATYFMDPETVDLVRAKVHVELTLQYATTCRAEGEDRFGFAEYYMLSVELNLALGEYDMAKEHIDICFDILNKNPESNRSYLVRAEVLKAIVDDAIKAGSDYFTL